MTYLHLCVTKIVCFHQHSHLYNCTKCFSMHRAMNLLSHQALRCTKIAVHHLLINEFHGAMLKVTAAKLEMPFPSRMRWLVVE